ncbi:MAG: hypothetical protein ACRDV2_13760 [Actinomycetes bacterium]
MDPDHDPGRVTVRVVDVDHHWTPLQRPEDQGCTLDGAYYSVPHYGATEQEAVRSLIDAGPDAAAEIQKLEGGYVGVEGYGFVLVRDGRPSDAGYVGRQGNRWHAGVDRSCAERLSPPAEQTS